MSLKKRSKKNTSKNGRGGRRIIFTLGFKTAVVITLMMVIFTVVAVYSAYGVMKRIIKAEQIESNYALGRSIAITSEQYLLSETFDRVREIYYSIPVEDRADPLDPAYQAKFEDAANAPEIKGYCSRLARVVSDNNLWWISLEFDDEALGRTVYVADSEPREDGKYDTGWWQETQDYEIRTVTVRNDSRRAQSLDAVADTDADEFSINIQYRETVVGLMEGDVKYMVVRSPFFRPGTYELIGYITLAEEESMITVEAIAFVVLYGARLMLLGILFILIGAFMMRRVVTQPVKKLTKAASSYLYRENKNEASHVFSDVEVRSHDEIRLLSDTMAQMETEVTEYMKNLASETAARERISTELDVAARIQKTFLPTKLTGFGRDVNFEIDSFMRPAKEVGGDFYDYFVIDDDNIGIVIADVSGKGVPAALFMVTTQTMVKNETIERRSPAEALKRVNERLMEKNEEMMFVTVWLGVYNVLERKLVYVNAGHEDTALYRAKEGCFDYIKEPHDIALGVLDECDFTEQTLFLEPGDRLFLYTDGVPEATASDDTRYGAERLIDCLNAHAADGGRALMEAVKSDADTFARGVDQYDDMTMVCFSINREDGEQEIKEEAE